MTAAADEVLVNKIIVTADGKVTAGTMPNNGAVEKTLHGLSPSYTIPKGHHDGNGVVKINQSVCVVTPSADEQIQNPMSGCVFTQVQVHPIPSTYVLAADVEAQLATI